MEFEAQCGFCEEGSAEDFPLMMNQALAVKHIQAKDEQHLAYIDHLLGLIPPQHPHHVNALVQLREDQYLADDEEFLKRIYKVEEFQPKIETLSQYYKFHNNIPRVLDRSIQRIIGRYHDKKRQCEYKKIKRLLKEEQGVSITSVAESQSDFQRSSVEKKSRYSTLLGDLQLSPQQMSDSKLLKEMCKEIDKVLPKKKKDSSFQLTGAFEQHKQYFQRFIKMQEQRRRLKGLKKDNKSSKVKLPFDRKPKVVDKCIYNTNIKIQIKNALFCSNQEFKSGPRISGGKLTDAIVFKKRGFLQQLGSWQPSSKFLNQIYKSSRLQPSIRPTQRIPTKESIRSSSKGKKSTKNNSLQQDPKRTLSNSHSTTRISQKPQIQSASNSKMIPKAQSSSNLRSRSSSHTTLTSTSFKKKESSAQKRPIELISRYGSSQTMLNRFDSKTKVRQKKVDDIISRKLHIKPM